MIVIIFSGVGQLASAPQPRHGHSISEFVLIFPHHADIRISFFKYFYVVFYFIYVIISAAYVDQLTGLTRPHPIQMQGRRATSKHYLSIPTSSWGHHSNLISNQDTSNQSTSNQDTFN